ncbi:acyltransferase [Desulfopila sp. IMCC35008]|uniref:acyltransferase n=1 Tax=Desulfopila sp. IMCC35008 TaxID=2653858 RepID=UPI0013D62C9B|nr:acyltransferase [Desulfopila sp. IMCC35008]
MSRYDDFTIAEYFRRQGAYIGNNNRLEIRSLGPEPYLVTIKNHCTIANNVHFLTHDGGVWVFSEEIPDIQKFGTITIHDNCFIGINSIILGNVSIGPNAIVGAGSVVTKNVPENSIVAGVPARTVSSLSDYKRKAVEIWKHQKPPGYFADFEYEGICPPSIIQKTKYRNLTMLRKHLTQVFDLHQR